tara:strand:+ start:11549 stop:12307 length:759 start_codon:yes stop_codon:yes gene_type:complete
MFEITILSLIQGITEFLPISSSAHLILLSNILEFKNQSLNLDVSLHIGSFMAIIIYFYKDFVNFIKNIDLFLKIAVSSIPIMVVGYLLVKFDMIDNLRNLKIIGWTTLIFGVLLYISDQFRIDKKLDKSFTLKSAIFIGFFQILALIPGVSRSGITITAARMLNFDRFDSAKISFLLSIPTLAAVSFFGIRNLMVNDNINLTSISILSIILSFIFSYMTIKFFLQYIRRFNLNIFVYYRVILGVLLLAYAYL